MALFCIYLGSILLGLNFYYSNFFHEYICIYISLTLVGFKKDALFIITYLAIFLVYSL